jgi:hypothetical protein
VRIFIRLFTLATDDVPLFLLWVSSRFRYMRICGFAAEALRSERMIHETFPSKQLQDYWATRPKYEDAPPVGNSGSTASGSVSGSGAGASSSSSSGPAGGSGADGEGEAGAAYAAWLAEQKEEKDEPPPPPYSLEADEAAAAPAAPQTTQQQQQQQQRQQQQVVRPLPTQPQGGSPIAVPQPQQQQQQPVQSQPAQPVYQGRADASPVMGLGSLPNPHDAIRQSQQNVGYDFSSFENHLSNVAAPTAMNQASSGSTTGYGVSASNTGTDMPSSAGGYGGGYGGPGANGAHAGYSIPRPSTAQSTPSTRPGTAQSASRPATGESIPRPATSHGHSAPYTTAGRTSPPPMPPWPPAAQQAGVFSPTPLTPQTGPRPSVGGPTSRPGTSHSSHPSSVAHTSVPPPHWPPHHATTLPPASPNPSASPSHSSSVSSPASPPVPHWPHHAATLPPVSPNPSSSHSSPATSSAPWQQPYQPYPIQGVGSASSPSQAPIPLTPNSSSVPEAVRPAGQWPPAEWNVRPSVQAPGLGRVSSANASIGGRPQTADSSSSFGNSSPSHGQQSQQQSAPKPVAAPSSSSYGGPWQSQPPSSTPTSVPQTSSSYAPSQYGQPLPQTFGVASQTRPSSHSPQPQAQSQGKSPLYRSPPRKFMISL